VGNEKGGILFVRHGSTSVTTGRSDYLVVERTVCTSFTDCPSWDPYTLFMLLWWY
jgi:hypothetical protein